MCSWWCLVLLRAGGKGAMDQDVPDHLIQSMGRGERAWEQGCSELSEKKILKIAVVLLFNTVSGSFHHFDR